MKYEQFNQVEEGDLVARYENQPVQVMMKDDIYITSSECRTIWYKHINQLWKKDSKGNYMKVEVER